MRFDDWQSVLERVDVVISSTGCPLTIVHRADVEKARHARKYRPLFFIDIAVPRDIDPAVGEIEEVYLYDIDTLEQLANEARARRQLQIEECERIIDAELAKFDCRATPLNGVLARKDWLGAKRSMVTCTAKRFFHPWKRPKKRYIYHFIFPDGSRKLFQITLDSPAHYRHPVQAPARIGPCRPITAGHCQLSGKPAQPLPGSGQYRRPRRSLPRHRLP